MPHQIRGSGSSVNQDLATVSLAMLGGRHDIYTPPARLASLVKLTIFSNEKNNLHLLIAEFGLFVLRAAKRLDVKTIFGLVIIFKQHDFINEHSKG